MAKMTKSELLNRLAEKNQLSRKAAGAFLDSLAEIAHSQVKSAGEFSLPGFGKFVKKHRAARMGRNPATGEQIQIKAKTVVKFRVAKAAKEAIL